MSQTQIIALLSGGISSEDYLSRRTAEYVYKLLENSPYELSLLDWKKNGSISLLEHPGGEVLRQWNSILHCFKEYRPDGVFNCLHGEKENSGQLQGFFNLSGIPLTGNELAPSVVGMDKMLSKDLFRRMGIATPKDFFLGHMHSMEVHHGMERFKKSGLDFPVMLKASHGGSSEGVALAEDEKEFQQLIRDWSQNPATQYSPVFLEEYIVGREFCVGIFGHWDQDQLTTLPSAEIQYHGKVFDKKIKYDNQYEVCLDFLLPPALRNIMDKGAKDIHRVLRFSGFSRMDYIIHKNIPYALEVNTHPGMSTGSIIPKMVRASSSLKMKDALIKMIDWAITDFYRISSHSQSAEEF